MKNLKIFKKKWRLFLAPGLIVFATLVLLFLGLIPRVQEINKLRERIRLNKERLASLTDKMASLEGLDEVALKEKAELSLKSLPFTNEVIKEISHIRKIGEESRVYLDSVEVSPGEISTESASQNPSGIEVLIFKIKASGEWGRILDFIKRTEETIPLLNLKMVKINISGSTSQAQIVSESYYAGLPKSLGKIDTPLPKLSKEEEEILELIGNFKDYESWAEFPAVLPPSSSVRTNPFSF